MKPYFSIVIPCLDEEVALPRLLGQIARQKEQDYEIIVVDGGSRDQTIRRAREWSKLLPLTVKMTKWRKVSKQRNGGAASARGKWLVFSDADSEIGEGFLTELRQQVERGEGEVYGLQLAVEEYQGKYLWLARLINLLLKLASWIKPQNMGAMLVIKRVIWSEVRFEEKMYYAEDRRIIETAVRAGWRYQLLETPRYKFNMRRFERMGIMRALWMYTRRTWMYYRGKQFSRVEKEYPMGGLTNIKNDIV